MRPRGAAGKRVLCLASPAQAAACRAAALDVGAQVDVPGTHPSTVSALAAAARAYDALCLPQPLPGGLGATAELALACLRAGISVLLAGPPVSGADAFEPLAAAAASGGALLCEGLLPHSALGRAAAGAAADGTVGAPVYLRFAAEDGGAHDLHWRVVDAIDLAERCLGPATSIYATTRRDTQGTPVHVAASVTCLGGAVSLLGVGAAASPRGGPSLLLIGNQGAVERNAAAGGVLLGEALLPGAPDGALRLAAPVRDDLVAALAAWLQSALGLLSDRAARGAALDAARHRADLLAAVRRSLAGGRAEPVRPARPAPRGAA
jgi:predicted dehydrogenase